MNSDSMTGRRFVKRGVSAHVSGGTAMESLMLTLADYLDLARERAGIPSDRALSRRLGLPPQMVCMFRSGAQLPTADTVRLTAELAEEDPFPALILLHMLQNNSPETRDVYARFFGKVRGGLIGVATGTAMALSPTHGDAQAAQRSMNNDALHAAVVYYGKCRRRLLGWFGRTQKSNNLSPIPG